MLKKLKIIEFVILLIINLFLFNYIIGLSAFYSISIFLGMYAFKLYENDNSITPTEIVIRYFAGFLSGSFLIFLISLFSNYLLSEFTLWKLLVSSLSIPIIHMIFYRFERKYIKPVRYVVLGKEDVYEDILEEITLKTRGNLLFIGYASTKEDLEIFNNNVNFDKLLISKPFINKEIRDYLDSKNIQRDYITTISEKYLKRIPLDILKSFDEYYKIFFSEKEEPKLKNLLDIFLSLIFLIVFSPIMLLVSILILIESGFPLIFKQQRFGKNAKPFNMIKFRTMDKDENILKTGKIIRKTRVDEVLQFLNVLKGDMSIVGPRPEINKFHNEMMNRIKYYNLRYQTKPGITGWAQIYYKYTQTIADYKKKTEYDLYYIKNRSLLIDFQIMLKTIETMFFHKGE